ncbi:MAG: hypothetical protein Q7Q71_13885 [Verrucomicrobiota bacterium JB023]|nr:hypothetical protein [Verrucomicrobiota bacterium JB023]
MKTPSSPRNLFKAILAIIFGMMVGAFAETKSLSYQELLVESSQVLLDVQMKKKAPGYRKFPAYQEAEKVLEKAQLATTEARKAVTSPALVELRAKRDAPDTKRTVYYQLLEDISKETDKAPAVQKLLKEEKTAQIDFLKVTVDALKSVKGGEEAASQLAALLARYEK